MLTIFPLYAYAQDDGLVEEAAPVSEDAPVEETTPEEDAAEEMPVVTAVPPEETEPEPEPEAEPEAAPEETTDAVPEETTVLPESTNAIVTLHKNDGTDATLLFDPGKTSYSVTLPGDMHYIALSTDNPWYSRTAQGSWNRQEDGYTLAGWYTASTLPDGAQVLRGSFSVTETISLYAQWEKNSWSWSDLTFYLEETDDTYYAQLNLLAGTTVGEDLPATPEDPTGQNRAFLGWHQKDSDRLHQDGSLADMRVQASYDSPQGYVFHAEWGDPQETEAPGGHPAKVTYVWSKGKVASVEYTSGPVYALDKQEGPLASYLTAYGITFSRWNTEADGSGHDIFPGEAISLSGEVTLHAIYTATVTFSSGGLSLQNADGGYSNQWRTTSVTMDCGSEYTLPELFDEWNVRETNRFLGWNTKMYSTADLYEVGTELIINKNASFYAVFDPHIVFNTNNIGKTGWYETVYYGPISNGEAITMPGVSDAAFDHWNGSAHQLFSHWNTAMANTASDYLPGQSYSLSQNVMVYAQAGTPSAFPTKVTYKSSYRNASASVAYTAGPVYALARDDSALAAFATRHGTTFSRWNTKADGTGRDFYPGDAIHLTGEVELHAIYSATVTFSSSGLSLQNADGTYSDKWDKISQTVDCGTEYTLPELFDEWVVRETNRFLGWNTSMHTTEGMVQPGTTMVINADTSIRAIFDPHIIYKTNNVGGTGWYGTIYYGPVSIGEPVTLPGMDNALFADWKTDTHKTFGHWSTIQGADGTGYLAGQSYTPDRNVSMYAQTLQPLANVDVNFHDEHHSSNSTFSRAFSTGGTVPATGWSEGSAYNRAFAGWNTQADATGDWYGGSYHEGALTSFGDVIPSDLYAQYTTTFTFDAGGLAGQYASTAPRVSIDVLVGQDNAVPTASDARFSQWSFPEGYNAFVGWSSSQYDNGNADARRYSADGSYGEATINTTSGELLYAIYNPRVTYDPLGFGGKWSQDNVQDDTSVTAQGGFELTLPDVGSDARFADWVAGAAAKGQVFTGWKINGENVLAGTVVKIYGNVTLNPGFTTVLDSSGVNAFPSSGTNRQNKATGTAPAATTGATSTPAAAAAPATVAAPPAAPQTLAAAAFERAEAAAEGMSGAEADVLNDGAMPLAAFDNVPTLAEEFNGGTGWLLIGTLAGIGFLLLLLFWRRRKDEEEKENA